MKTTIQSIALIAICLLQFHLVSAQVTELWGMTPEGGVDDVGTIIKINSDGTGFTTMMSFEVNTPGRQPSRGHLIQASNGKLYGMTSQGGISDEGVLFEYETTGNTYTDKIQFDGPNKGGRPEGSLLEATNGKLYGMTSRGGSNSYGVLFEYDPGLSTFTKKVDFDGAALGRGPKGSLVEATNGKLYGMTYYGGLNGDGVLFEYDPIAGNFTKKVDFDNAATGGNPWGSLLEASNGKLYGMTQNGGSNDHGVLFEYDPVNNIFIKKVDFESVAKGSHPFGSLIEAANGKLYGMTTYGGINDHGVLFEYDIVGNSLIKKLDFDNLLYGRGPFGSLVEAIDGKLYGMTSAGGLYDNGVLFEYDPPTNSFAKNVDFFALGNNWRIPYGSLLQIANGKMYGMTRYGGNHLGGVLFEYNPVSDTIIKKIDFDEAIMGRTPHGSLLETSNNKFYGMTEAGGAYDDGVLFEFDPVNITYNVKIHFNDTISGKQPNGSLIEGANGMLYGMTSEGGLNDDGVLFEYNHVNGTFIKKLDFNGMLKGSTPIGSLLQATNGMLYGMTRAGGSNFKGALFEYDPIADVFTKKIDFDGSAKGERPHGNLIEAANGKLYGLTSRGGSNSKGVLFEYNPMDSTFSKKVDFDGSTNGNLPYGSLLEATDGKLYGMTYYGGSSNSGTLFEYDPIGNLLTKKGDFDNVPKGRYPSGSLMEASNGALYGMTSKGGINDLGVLFSYSPSVPYFVKLKDLSQAEGASPTLGHFIEKTISIGPVCNQPTSLFTSHIAITTATLNWNAIVSATKYNIRGHIPNTPNWTYVQINNPSQTQFQANGLSINTSYEWQIQSICGVGDSSAWSVLDTFTTGCYPTDSIWTNPVTQTAAKLNWQPIPGAQAYEIKGKRVGTTNWVTLLQSSLNSYKDVFGLASGFSYHWTVRAWCDSAGNFTSPWVGLDTFSTLTLGNGNRLVGTSKASLKESELRLFPNPAPKIATIVLPEDEFAQIRIWSSTGQLIGKQELTGKYTEINTENWPSGIYLLEASTNTNSFKKFRL